MIGHAHLARCLDLAGMWRDRIIISLNPIFQDFPGFPRLSEFSDRIRIHGGLYGGIYGFSSLRGGKEQGKEQGFIGGTIENSAA